jgi:hypothetical protein
LEAEGRYESEGHASRFECTACNIRFILWE